MGDLYCYLDSFGLTVSIQVLRYPSLRFLPPLQTEQRVNWSVFFVL